VPLALHKAVIIPIRAKIGMSASDFFMPLRIMIITFLILCPLCKAESENAIMPIIRGIKIEIFLIRLKIRDKVKITTEIKKSIISSIFIFFKQYILYMLNFKKQGVEKCRIKK